MATHQETAGISDQQLVERMVQSHDGRFSDLFWHYFKQQVGNDVTAEATMVDVGCGPGLFLRDLSERYQQANLLGYDITPAMLDYARQVSYSGQVPTFDKLDLIGNPIPLADHSVDFLSIVAVLHVLPDPEKTLAEIRRVLKPEGVFMLYDWVRQPLAAYLERMAGNVPEEQQEIAKIRSYALFPDHNKFTQDDWHWLLDQTGFRVIHDNQVESPHFRLWFCRAGE